MSTSRNVYLVYGFRVPRSHALFGDDSPDEWLEQFHDQTIYPDPWEPRAFGDPECSDDRLIGTALVEIRNYPYGPDFREVTKLEPEPKAKNDIARIAALFGPDVTVGLFVCGESC